MEAGMSEHRPKRVSFTSSQPQRSRTDTEFSSSDEVSLFFASCKVDDALVVDQLLSADPLLVDHVRKGTTPLHVAAANKADKCVVAILKVAPAATLKRDKAGFSPFARATEAGHLSTMGLLFEARPDSLRDRDLALYTPLHRAAGNGRVEACKFLLDRGALIDDPEYKLVETPMFHACRYGAAEVVELLLQRGANVNAFNESYSTCLHTTILSMKERIGQSSKVLRLLIAHGAQMNCQNNFQQTPLSLAIQLGCIEAVSVLLRAGADPELAPYGCPSPFNDVIERNLPDMLQAFENGLGRPAVVSKLCELSRAMDPCYILGKHLFIIDMGKGFCVEVYRPFLNLFGPITHVIRFTETGVEKALILDRDGVPDGVKFYLLPDENFERPLCLGGTSDCGDD